MLTARTLWLSKTTASTAIKAVTARSVSSLMMSAGAAATPKVNAKLPQTIYVVLHLSKLDSDTPCLVVVVVVDFKFPFFSPFTMSNSYFVYVCV